MKEQTSIVLMNFSGIYEEERFWKERQVSWIDAIAMMRQSQKSIKEQKTIRLPEFILSIPAIITI